MCAGLGSVAGYGYLQLLMRDVDSFRQDDPIAEAFLMAEDSRLEFAALRYDKCLLAIPCHLLLTHRRHVASPEHITLPASSVLRALAHPW